VFLLDKRGEEEEKKRKIKRGKNAEKARSDV